MVSVGTLSPMSAPAEGLPVLAGKRILLAVSGGVAVYKCCELVRLLTQQGAQVRVLMSASATRFVTPVTFQALSGQDVFVDSWDARPVDGVSQQMPHIPLGRHADVMLVAPATADVLARLAMGRADDLLGLTALARPRDRVSLIVAPAMNREMWSHPATQRHVQQLQWDGTLIWGPAAGEQACGEVGEGRMLEPQEMLDRLEAHFTQKTLAGRKLLITAGPTFEAMDPVRGITNHSSGKMGFAIARAAAEAGAEVTLVAGPVCLDTPLGVRRIDVQSAEQMLAATMENLPGQDAFIATAAVADWRPMHAAVQKIKKTAGASSPTVLLEENPDILKEVASRCHATGAGTYCVGFAAESENMLEHASAKRLRKGIPLIVGNLGPDTFGKDDNTLALIDSQGVHSLPRASKRALGQALIQDLARRLDRHLPRTSI